MTEQGGAGRYRKPGPGVVPDLADVAEQAAFEAMSQRSQEDVAASAERWRNGLAGLTTLVTGALLLKGPANAADLDVGWRAVLTALFGLGLAGTVGGLWFALRAAAGVPATVRFDELRRRYGSVRLYRLDLARRAAVDLRRARTAAMLSVVLLVVAVLSWWWAPTDPGTGPLVSVTHGGAQSCGTVVDSDTAGLRLAVKDNPTRVTIPWAAITAIKPATTCGVSR